MESRKELSPQKRNKCNNGTARNRKITQSYTRNIHHTNKHKGKDNSRTEVIGKNDYAYGKKSVSCKKNNVFKAVYIIFYSFDMSRKSNHKADFHKLRRLEFERKAIRFDNGNPAYRLGSVFRTFTENKQRKQKQQTESAYERCKTDYRIIIQKRNYNTKNNSDTRRKNHNKTVTAYKIARFNRFVSCCA